MPKPVPFKIEWQAHEHEHKERSQDWFWAVSIVAIAIAIVSVIFNNVIFGILVIIATFSLMLFINRKPDTIYACIDEQGITRNNVRYPYDTLHSFWVDELHPHKKIILKSQKTFMPLIIVPIPDDMNADKLHHTLERFLPAEYLSLPFAERILEYFGF